MGREFYKKDALNFAEMHDMIVARNRYYLDLLVKFGLAYALLNAAMQMFVMRDMAPLYCFLNIAFFIFANIVNHIIDEHSQYGIHWLYFFITIAFIIAIAMGTIWDPSHIAVTFMAFIVFLPAFMIDRPTQHITGTLFWMLAFIICSYLVKGPHYPKVFKSDVFCVVSFGLTSIMVNQFILLDRLSAISQDLQIIKTSEHDPLTDLQNRVALKRKEAQYYNKQIIAGFLDIDDYKLLCDYYGHGLGHAMLLTFTQSLISIFPKENVYRYGDDDFLIVIEEKDPQVFEKKIKQTQEHLKWALKKRQSKIMTSFCTGYVYGQVDTEQQFMQMIRHAHVRVSEAKLLGRGQMAGSFFDESATREEKIIRELRNQYNEASLDPMTGVYNLSTFRVEANLLPDDVKEVNSILYFNIDDLKSYNEAYGYQAGDALIKAMAKSIEQSFSKKLICRLGEDHFVALVYNKEVEKGIQQVYRTMLSYNSECKVYISVGIYPLKAHENIISGCDRAKMACDLIRNNYDRYFQYYEDSLSDESRFRNYILTHIETAARVGDLKVYYQGVVNTITKKPCGAEALVRWEDPEYGMIYPNHFIPALERANLIHIVDLFVIEQVCRDYAEAKKKGQTVYPVSVNLSRQDFFISHFYEDVIGYVEMYHVPVNMLNLEVTERIMSSHNKVIFDILNRFKDYGFEIWMDDFGSEYSSLNMMSQFAFDVIKLDMNFMRNFKSGQHSRDIIASIVSLTKTMGGKTLSEGVEDEEQYDYLKSVGCDMIQGYYFFKPQPKTAFQKEAEDYENQGAC